MKPNFKHDCERCVFLGNTEEGFDLYYCQQKFGESFLPTIICRYSNKEEDYKSGLVFKYIDPHFKQAYELAKERGLINETM